MLGLNVVVMSGTRKNKSRIVDDTTGFGKHAGLWQLRSYRILFVGCPYSVLKEAEPC